MPASAKCKGKVFILSVKGVSPCAAGGRKNGPEGLSKRGAWGQQGADTGTEKEESMEESAHWGTSMQKMEFVFQDAN